MRPNRRPEPLTLAPLPEGKRVQDVLPAFAAVTDELGPIGEPCPVCPGCSKPFTVARKRRLGVRLYPANSPVPVVLRYDLCGKCSHAFREKGAAYESLIAHIQAFVNGDEIASPEGGAGPKH